MELYKQPGSKFWTADFIVDGRRFRKSTKETVKARADEVAAGFQRQARQKQTLVVRKEHPTLRQFAEEHFLPLTEANAKIEPTTKDYYRLGWLSLENQSIANQRIDAIRSPHINTIHIEGSNATHNRALRTLRRMLHVASDLDILTKVPKFSLLEETGRTQLLTADIERKVAEQLAKSKRKNSLKVALYIILDCGLRPKEIVGLRISDLDFETGTIRVNRANTKTRAGVRSVAMTSRVRDFLRTQIGKRTDGWLFPSPRYQGQPIKRHALTAAWRRIAGAAGIDEDVDLYCGRHTYGTDVMKATKDPFLTMRLLGHTDLKTTERYQHPELGHVGGLMDARNKERSMSYSTS